MPLPFLVVGLGLAAAAVGAGGHMVAKDINAEAERTLAEAQRVYNNAKRELEAKKSQTEKTLTKLGNHKVNVLNSSINQFLSAYDRIKHIQLSESIGMNEIAKFSLDDSEALSLQKMSSIYQNSVGSAVAGVATGVALSLAVSGTLPVVTGALSTAGSALMAGQVGAAAGLAGSAVSLGAAVTPLAAVVAPAVLFTAITANVKAEENLSKAKRTLAQADAAAEKMKTSVTMCNAISERTDMLDDLLIRLNRLFAPSVESLDRMTRKKMGILGKKKITQNDLSREDLELIAVARALAGAVKSVIDTPILDSSGDITYDSEKVYEQTIEQLPAFDVKVKETVSYKQIAKYASSNCTEEDVKKSKRNAAAHNPVACVVGMVLGFIIGGISGAVCHSPFIGVLVFSIICLMGIPKQTDYGFFSGLQKTLKVLLLICFSLLMLMSARVFVSLENFAIIEAVIGFPSFIAFEIFARLASNRCGGLFATLAAVFGCLLHFVLALVAFALMFCVFNWSYGISIGIAIVLFAIFGYGSIQTAFE